MRMSRCLLPLACLVLVLHQWGCAVKQPGLTERLSPEAALRSMPSSSQGLRSWRDLEPSILESLVYVRKKNPGEPAIVHTEFTTQGEVTWERLERGLTLLVELLPKLDATPELLLEHFVWVPVRPDVLLTGYYEPFLEASLIPHPDYPHAIYAPPPGLEKGVPHHSRAEIDFQGALAGQGLEIAWAKDLVDVYFLHVQGSGRLVLPDGEVKHVLYAGTNQHEYVGLGRALIDRGHATKEEMSMQKIREILAAYPEKRVELLSLNPKYIFFKISDAGPFGASGAVLTPMVSVAVDRGHLPLGAIMAVRGDLPDGSLFSGLTLAQDTGTMRRNHLDLFCGAGEKAAALAGKMRGRAAAWLLLPRR